MYRIELCSRYRSVRTRSHTRFALRRPTCRRKLPGSLKSLRTTAMSLLLVLLIPAPGAINADSSSGLHTVEKIRVPTVPDRALVAAEDLLARHNVDERQRERVARAVAISSRRYEMDPRLVTSIMIVESHANQWAISNRQAVGIMQVHLGTWGERAEQEGINLFRIEDNVDFGVRILKEYVERYGLWGGVRRYRGWTTAPGSREGADRYVEKVRRIYNSHIDLPVS